MDVNYKKAFEWYEKAAKQRLAEAQYNLGGMYNHGQGVDRVIPWRCGGMQAAAQGHEKAQARITAILKKRRVSSTPAPAVEASASE